MASRALWLAGSRFSGALFPRRGWPARLICTRPADRSSEAGDALLAADPDLLTTRRVAARQFDPRPTKNNRKTKWRTKLPRGWPFISACIISCRREAIQALPLLSSSFFFSRSVNIWLCSERESTLRPQSQLKIEANKHDQLYLYLHLPSRTSFSAKSTALTNCLRCRSVVRSRHNKIRTSAESHTIGE